MYKNENLWSHTAHSARWDETFSLQIADEEAVLTFFVWEQVDNLSKYDPPMLACLNVKSYRNRGVLSNVICLCRHLGTAIVHLGPLLNELNTMPQPLQKECYLKGQGDDSHVESKSPMGILKLSFGKQYHFIKNSQQRGICDISGGLTMSLAKKMECSQSAIFLVYGHWWILFRRTIIGLVPCPQLILVLKRRFPHPDSH